MPFTCPFHSAPVAVKCGLRRCDFWVKHHDLRCALIAIQQNFEDWKEDPDWFAARLLGLSRNEVQDKVDRCYEMLRVSILQQDSHPQFTLVPDTRRCIVCGRKANIVKDNWGWCSPECYKWMPLAAVKLEQDWGDSLRNLLHRWRKVKIRTLTDITGLDYNTLKWLIWQHTGYSKIPTPRRWLKQREPLFTVAPSVPSKERLLKRIRKAELWTQDYEKYSKSSSPPKR